MPILVNPLLTISQTELDRANKALTDLDKALDELSSARTAVSSLQAQVAALQAELATRPPAPPPTPPVTPPPPPPQPPTTGRVGLYVDGNKLRTKKGSEVQIRGIELMHNSNTAGVQGGVVELCNRLKALGANCISPLFQGSQGSVANVKALCDAAKAAGLIVGINADHQSNGRAWLCDPVLVALLNKYDHVFLECEIETDGVATNADWVNGASSLVKALRTAGHVHPIKVGAPQGGRMVKFPLASAKQVFDTDPLKNTMFTFQNYWKESTVGWQYSEANGFASGIAGSRQALTACSNSGFCFLPGFDWRDDVGTTGMLQLMDHAHTMGMSYQIWVLTGDGMYPENNFCDWDINLNTISATGAQVRDKLLAQRKLADL